MKKLIDIETASDILNIKKAQCYAMVREGILPVVKVGRQYRFDPDVLQEWIRAGGQSFSGGWRRNTKAITRKREVIT